MTEIRRANLEPSYVLHRYDYRESSLLVEIYSQKWGRVGLVARGARAPRKGLQCLLEPFRPLLLSWSIRGELGTLTGLESGGTPVSLTGRTYLAACYLNELLLKMVPREDPQPDIYHLYDRTLQHLDDRLEVQLRYFESAFIRTLGYPLPLTTDSEGQPVDPLGHYRYDVEVGPIPVGSHGSGVSGSGLLALERRQLEDADALSTARQVLRTVIDAHLDGKELRTRQVGHALAALKSGSRITKG